MKAPNGKHIFGLVKVGEKGQIVIPKKAREIFNIKPGDSLMLVGDETSGLGILTNNELTKLFSGIIREPEKK